MNITVLGAGMVGSASARDLARESAFRVTAVDRDHEALGRLSRLAPVATVHADLSDGAAVTAAVSPADLVVCAVPGFLGFQTLKAILQAGKNVVDISFFPEEAHQNWPSKGVTAGGLHAAPGDQQHRLITL